MSVLFPKIPALLHGGDYNPDQWLDRPDILEEDIKMMKKAGVNTATVGVFSWSALEPQEGNFQFGWLHDIMDKLYENGIYTVLATPTGARPAWMDEKYPSVLRVEKDGRRNHHSGRHNHCMSSLEYRSLVEKMDTKLAQEFGNHVAVQAGIEIGFERFLEEKNYHAIVTHFGDLGGLKQLPGLAIQRLMEKGYGFGAEGDWKTAAMVRVMKIMTEGMKETKGTSFMEDYTYNLVPGKEGILQSHMLEVCPTIADGKICIKEQPLSMGDREDPARLVFTAKTGPAIATSLIDLGDRFRLIINDVDCKKVEKPMPKLPVATAFWTPRPNLQTGTEAWILAGGAHHTAFSYDLTAEQMGDWAAAMGIEAVYIDQDTRIRQFKNELLWNSAVYRK